MDIIRGAVSHFKMGCLAAYGSLSLKAGDTWSAGVWSGSTNLRNYANLNFDPNEGLMESCGYRWTDNHSIALQIVRDNRLNPDQQNVHLVYRTPINGGDRLTLDLLKKKGWWQACRLAALGYRLAMTGQLTYARRLGSLG